MTQKIRRHLTRDVDCPTCHVHAGRACTAPTMRRRRDEHGKPATVEVRWLHHERKAAAA